MAKQLKGRKVAPLEEAGAAAATRDYFRGEAKNGLVAFGLLPGDKLEAQLIKQLLEEDHGKPKKSGLLIPGEKPGDCLNRLGIGEKTGTRRIERGDDF